MNTDGVFLWFTCCTGCDFIFCTFIVFSGCFPWWYVIKENTNRDKLKNKTEQAHGIMAIFKKIYSKPKQNTKQPQKFLAKLSKSISFVAGIFVSVDVQDWLAHPLGKDSCLL